MYMHTFTGVHTYLDSQCPPLALVALVPLLHVHVLVLTSSLVALLVPLLLHVLVLTPIHPATVLTVNSHWTLVNACVRHYIHV